MAPRAVLLSVLALSAARLPAQDPDRLEVLPLTDGWRFAVETTPGEMPSEGWRAVTVPSTFEDHLGPDFDGVCWYRRVLALDPARIDGATVRLHFRGAATDATVFFNGAEVGGHLGAWTPWRVDLTEHVNPEGGNALAIRVDEKVGHNTQGFLPVIQPHFGGLWRGVDLEIDRAPRFDPDTSFVFGKWNGGNPKLIVNPGILGHDGDRGTMISLELLDGDRRLNWVASMPVESAAESPEFAIDALGIAERPRPWSPAIPKLYTLRLRLLNREQKLLDEWERKIGFRDLATDGTTILWNGHPLQLRGMLHWGYSPPHFAPPEDPAFWRPQLEQMKALGCNLLKCCLWIPPRCVYEIADELGMIVWQEYPTWHPKLTAEFLPELRQEYEEFHRYDRSYASVALRSLTCETGHSAELAVIQSLYDRCKELTPDTLVVDDSAWITWHRVHDFYDDHPYGNNAWWPGKLADMKRYIADREAMPLLLGECITSDTWVDLSAWDALGVADDAWWAPWCVPAQREFERWATEQFGRGTVASLLEDSKRYALRNRKYQIERLRLTTPDAGYVLSVWRDFTKARMGFVDDTDALKWSPEEWSWHGDTMLSLDTAEDRRAFPSGTIRLPVRVSHFGRGELTGALTLAIPELGLRETIDGIALGEGEVAAPGSALLAFDHEVDAPTRLRFEARLAGSHPVESHWDIWVFPRPAGTLDPDVRIVETLDAATVDWIRGGGKALLLAGDRKGSLKTSGIWFLKGAPFTPPHPIHATLPPEFLQDIQGFDLDAGRVLHWEPWMDQVDPVLAFWDTHDIRGVNRWLLAATAGFGAGRLGMTVLNHDSPAGRYVLERLVDHLAGGPEPGRAWQADTIDTLRGALTGETIDLPDWQIALDPDDLGRGRGWARGDGTPDWRPIRAGRHWEAQGIEQYDGVAWYETEVAIPASWSGQTVRLVCEGVDDSYHLFVNGELLASHGDPDTGDTVWLVRTVTELGSALRPGETNRITLRVVDHVGAGGLHRPVWITNGPVDAKSGFVH